MGGAIRGMVGLEYIKKVAEHVSQQCSSMVLLQLLLNETNVGSTVCPLRWFQMYPHKLFSNSLSSSFSYTYACRETL